MGDTDSQDLPPHLRQLYRTGELCGIPCWSNQTEITPRTWAPPTRNFYRQCAQALHVAAEALAIPPHKLQLVDEQTNGQETPDRVGTRCLASLTTTFPGLLFIHLPAS